jgi:hypothetical protein
VIVRCIDNTLQRDVLVVAREYEVRDDRYILSGFEQGFSKTRFEIVRACRLFLAIASRKLACLRISRCRKAPG